MGSEELRKRKTWQDYSGLQATTAEQEFYNVFHLAFKGTSFTIRKKPSEFQNIYKNVALSPQVISEIYKPAEIITRHGIKPDFAIDNNETKKTLYVEVKRQDGWVEGGKRSDGRGNAHERSCKYFTPGLMKIMRSKGIDQADALPFWIVFQGDITRDPCRVREITCWYEGFDGHFFFWRDSSNPEPLYNHFVLKLSHLLD